MSDQRRSRSGRTEEIVDEDLLRMPRKSLVAKYKNALALVRSLEAEAEEVAICSKCNNSCKDRELADQFTQKLTIQEIFLRKNLAVKELEVQEKTAQLTALKNSIQSNSISSLQCLLQDPAANIVIQKLREDLSATKTKLEETQNELLAWKFTPDSNIGKQLMGRVRLLLAENKELGEEINSGRIAKLEGELALQKQFVEEVKNSQLEIDQFLQDLDEDTEGAQIVIYALESQLKNCRVCDEDTDDEETKSNNVSGIKRYSNGTIKDIPSVSKTETLTLSMESKSEKKSSKCKKSKDPKDMNDNKSNQLAEGEYQKKSRRKAHKKKHKSDRRKGEEKRPKVEKGTHSDNSLRAKNSKPKSTDLITSFATVDG